MSLSMSHVFVAFSYLVAPIIWYLESPTIFQWPPPCKFVLTCMPLWTMFQRLKDYSLARLPMRKFEGHWSQWAAIIKLQNLQHVTMRYCSHGSWSYALTTMKLKNCQHWQPYRLNLCIAFEIASSSSFCRSFVLWISRMTLEIALHWSVWILWTDFNEAPYRHLDSLDNTSSPLAGFRNKALGFGKLPSSCPLL